MFDQVMEKGEETFVDWFAELFAEDAVPVTFPVRRYAQPPGPEGSRVRRTPREHGVGGKCDIGYVFTNFAGGAMTKASFAGVLAPRGARCVPRAWGGAAFGLCLPALGIGGPGRDSNLVGTVMGPAPAPLGPSPLVDGEVLKLR